VSVYDHPEWHAFIRAIRENLAEDTTRVVAADWLDERDEVGRAELIRLQVQLALFNESSSDPALPDGGGEERHEMESREKQLLGGPNPRPLDTALRGSYVRGFLDSLECSASAWLDQGDELILREPVRAVTMTSRPEVETGSARRFWRLQGDRGTFEIDNATVTSRAEEIARRERPGLGHSDGSVYAILEQRWPGIDFTLPPAVMTVPVQVNGELFDLDIEIGTRTTPPLSHLARMGAGAAET